MNKQQFGLLALFGYIGSIVGANVAITIFGFVPVWLGIVAPAGVFAVGVSLTLRDLVQDTLGRRWTAGAILVGAALSALISPSLALASGTAFLCSEFADFLVYTPLKERNWLAAVGLSNTVGLVADSILFLWLAFGSLAYLEGQVIGKIEMTLLAVALLAALEKRRATTRIGSN